MQVGKPLEGPLVNVVYR